MSVWAIDEEENHGGTGNREGETVGKEDYMIVLHYPRLRPIHFKPQHQEKDQDGRLVMNPFNKSTPKLEEGDLTSVYQKLTHSWKTSKPDLDALDTDAKSFCNSIKAFLNKHKVAVFFHNSSRDECAKYQGAHLHILYHSELTGSGQFQALWQRAEWVTMQKKAKSAGGYCRCLGVKNLEGAIKHFNTEPRICMGTSYTPYGKLLIKARQNKLPTSKWDEIMDEDDNSMDVTETDFGDFDDIPPTKKRTRDDFEDEQKFVVLPKSTSTYKVKENDRDTLVRLISVLCLRWEAWTKRSLFRKSAEFCELEAEQPYIQLWYRLSTRTGIDGVIKTVKQKQESLTMYKPFAQLIAEYCEQVIEVYDADGMLEPKESYRKMLAWLEWQHIDVQSFLDNVFEVMDRINPKINTLTMIGPPNSGKTTMFSVPLRQLCKHVGQIGNRGANSDFIYQECLNKRMIAIDECVMNPGCLEDLKLLTAGENLLSNCKSADFEPVVRTPCILTGNKEPWILDKEAEVAFMTRMLKYEVLTCPELADVRGISPKMWWYLMQLKVTKDPAAVEKMDLKPPEPCSCGVDIDDLNE